MRDRLLGGALISRNRRPQGRIDSSPPGRPPALRERERERELTSISLSFPTFEGLDGCEREAAGEAAVESQLCLTKLNATNLTYHIRRWTVRHRVTQRGRPSRFCLLDERGGGGGVDMKQKFY